MAAGIGFMGVVARLALSYSGDPGPTAPATVIAKIPTTDANVRALLGPARVFEREARFYAELSGKVGIRTPECYFSGFDVDADEYLIIMEDLVGVDVGDQLRGVTVDQARAACVAVAKMHAKLWESPMLAGLAWLPDVNADINKIGQAIYAASWPGFQQAFGATLDPAMVPIAERFGDNVAQLLDRCYAMPKTLLHFDYRADNLFFDADGGVLAIDFQAISRGGGVYDVGYFLSQNLSVADRREHEISLLHAYHDTLTANGVTGYSFEQLGADYRVGVLYGWIIPVFAVGTLDFTSERAVSLWTAVIERSQTAILDHGCADLLL